jgi:hypothetical protein
MAIWWLVYKRGIQTSPDSLATGRTQQPEEGSREKFRNVMYIVYFSDNTDYNIRIVNVAYYSPADRTKICSKQQLSFF